MRIVNKRDTFTTIGQTPAIFTVDSPLPVGTIGDATIGPVTKLKSGAVSHHNNPFIRSQRLCGKHKINTLLVPIHVHLVQPHSGHVDRNIPAIVQFDEFEIVVVDV